MSYQAGTGQLMVTYVIAEGVRRADFALRTQPHRKSGGMGHSSFVREREEPLVNRVLTQRL